MIVELLDVLDLKATKRLNKTIKRFNTNNTVKTRVKPMAMVCNPKYKNSIYYSFGHPTCRQNNISPGIARNNKTSASILAGISLPLYLNHYYFTPSR
jgi:hypothetical protein